MSTMGLLIDYDYCCGCHTCEVACQKHNGYSPDVWGMKCMTVGPYVYPELDGKVIYDIVPVPTDLCTLCVDLTSKGELPSCVHHCQTGCISYGDIESLAKKLAEKPKQALFSR